mmetsp:Transcript_64556/g.199794  ORF Transcript_64556/g.199794 Transcript_64556/m.199794 type:complete len:371 (+) Transcript_64556:399-1511(+)
MPAAPAREHLSPRTSRQLTTKAFSLSVTMGCACGSRPHESRPLCAMGEKASSAANPRGPRGAGNGETAAAAAARRCRGAMGGGGASWCNPSKASGGGAAFGGGAAGTGGTSAAAPRAAAGDRTARPRCPATWRGCRGCCVRSGASGAAAGGGSSLVGGAAADSFPAPTPGDAARSFFTLCGDLDPCRVRTELPVPRREGDVPNCSVLTLRGDLEAHERIREGTLPGEDGCSPLAPCAALPSALASVARRGEERPVPLGDETQLDNNLDARDRAGVGKQPRRERSGSSSVLDSSRTLLSSTFCDLHGEIAEGLATAGAGGSGGRTNTVVAAGGGPPTRCGSSVVGLDRGGGMDGTGGAAPPEAPRGQPLRD